MATAEPARALRFANVPLGAWIAVAPWIFGAPTAAALSGGVAGALLVFLSIPRRTIRDEYGQWWSRYVV